MKLDTILVPFDFSAHGVRAFKEGVELALQNGAHLVLLHAFVLNDRVYPYNLFLTEQVIEEARQAVAKSLDEWRERAEAAGVDVEVRLSPAEPTEAIGAVAEELGAGLIVMGSRGLTGLKHLLLGSVAEHTIATAPCPVLVVRALDTDEPAAPPA